MFAGVPKPYRKANSDVFHSAAKSNINLQYDKILNRRFT